MPRPASWPRTWIAAARANRFTPHRASPVERGAKWARRRPAAAALLALGLAAFLGLTVGGAFYEHNRRVAGESQSQHVVKLLQEVNGLTVKAREANTVQDLSQVQLDLSEFLGSLSKEGDPRLESLPGIIKASLEKVDRRLRELRDREEKEKQALADRQHFQDFLAKQTQAQFHAASIEFDAADSRGRLRDAARAGLAIYARDPQAGEESWSLASTLPEVLAAGEKTRIAAVCYDLLLLLSDAVEPASGLTILDRAARLRPSRPRLTTCAGPAASPGSATPPASNASKSWPASSRPSPHWITS